ncbi:MAG: DUF4160 domain-containing protein [Bacteroidota bacterium]
MPKISFFYGIIIKKYFDDHNPPHFHAEYAEFNAKIGIKDFALQEGNLPSKAMALVVEGAIIHQKELLENWNLMLERKSLNSIEPLR